MATDPFSLELFKVLLKWCWEKTSNQIEKIDFNNTATKEKLVRACQDYIENYRHRYGKISVLGMHKPAELENIYTNVQIIEGRNLWRYESPQAQELAYRNAANRRFQFDNGPKQDGIDIANKYQYLMVLGQPGAGKSTFLKRIGLAALQGKEDRSRYHIQRKLPGLKPNSSQTPALSGTTTSQTEKIYIHELMPVLIELKRWDREEIDLVDKIQLELENCGFESANVLTQTLLSKGGMLILLDGLDEITSSNLNRAITQIQNFVNKYKKNRFIISCRTAAYKGGFNNLTNVEMADFDDEQIQQFINNWFCQEQDMDAAVASSCWQLLNTEGYQATKELSHTPLLLTFLCLVYDELQTFPVNRAALYRKALDILLQRWSAEKRIQRDEIYKDLTNEIEELLLAEIAYEQFERDRLFFDKRETIFKIRSYLADNLNAPKYLDGEKVLQEIQVQQGILVERSSDILSFSHLTLQEYLTAQHIIDRYLINQLVNYHLTDFRWREVFLLVAGLMREGRDPLLLKMAMSTSQLLDTQKLRNLVNWAEETTNGIQSKVNSLAQRNLALLIAYANAYAHTYSNANANMNTNTSKYANSNAYAYAEANAEAYAYAIAYANTNASAIGIANATAIAIELIENLSELQIFNHLNYISIANEIKALLQQIRDNHQSTRLHQEFPQRLVEIWCNALSIELDWLNLSDLEIKNLDRYFTANLLIMECKEAAVSISAKGWAEVENIMFKAIRFDDDW